MEIVVVANNKGGTGKSTLSVMLSNYFARQGLRTLGMDFDPQCNYSRRFVQMEIDPENPEIMRPPLHPAHESGIEFWHGRNSTADIFYEGSFVVGYETEVENLEIIPGHSTHLLGVERVTEFDLSEKVHSRLMEWFGTWEEDYFDVVIIDTGPSKGPLTTSALHAADHIIIPAEMEELSVEGLYGMLAYWRGTNLQRPKDRPLNLIGVLANKYDERLPIHRHYFDALSEHPMLGKYMLPVKMHNWQDYKEAMMQDGKPVLALPPKNKTRLEAESICQMIEERIHDHVHQKQGQAKEEQQMGESISAVVTE